MKAANKQMALKAGLLVILAANVGSFGSAGHTSKQVFHTAELASGSEVGTGRGTVPGRTAPDNIPAVRISPPPAAPADGPQPDKAVGTARVGIMDPILQTICSLTFKITYSKTSEAGVASISADVHQQSPSRSLIAVSKKVSPETLASDADAKARFDSDVKFAVLDKLTAEGRTCPDDVASLDSDRRTAPRDSDSRARDREIARGERNCSLNSDGSALKGLPLETCSLKHLENMSLDISDDVDSRGRPSTRAKNTIQDVEAALKPLEQSIETMRERANLLAKSPSEKNQDKASDLKDQVDSRIDDVVSALEAVRGTAVDPKDAAKIDAKIEGLNKGFSIADKAQTHADNLEARLSAIDKIIDTMKNQSAMAQNPYQKAQIDQQIQQAMTFRTDPRRMQSWISQDPNYSALIGDMNSLQLLQRSNAFDTSVYAGLTSPYTQMMQDFSGSSVGSPLSMTAPSDILAGRQQAITNDYRSYGLTLPSAAPQVNFGQLGNNNGLGTNQFQQQGQLPGQFQGQTQGVYNSNATNLTPQQQIAQMNGGVSNQSTMFSQQNRNSAFMPYQNGQPQQFGQSQQFGQQQFGQSQRLF